MRLRRMYFSTSLVLTLVSGSGAADHDIHELESDVLAHLSQEREKRQVVDDHQPFQGLPREALNKTETGPRVRDCQDLDRTASSALPSGVYNIQPLGYREPFRVFCDFETAGGRWTVIQRRLDGSVNFDRGWAEYKDGFGDLDTEFWLGNDKISALTSQKKYRLRIELTGRSGPPYYAQYSFFSVSNEQMNYKLSLGSYSGDTGNDALNYHRGMAFSTKDLDNDETATENCAVVHGGGWWHKSCDHANLNGRYGTYAENGVEWYDHPSGHYSLRFTEMKIRSA